MTFSRLIRFVDETGSVRYGDLAEELAAHQIVGVEVDVLEGSPFEALSRKGEKATVKKVVVSAQHWLGSVSFKVADICLVIESVKICAYIRVYWSQLSTTRQ
jgi:hypothetical protein